MNASSNERIDNYLKRARQAWDDDQPPPDGQTLRGIAEDVGMTHEDSEDADRRAGEFTVRAGELLEKDDQQAEQLLRDAVLLSPVRLQPFYLLARLYARRYSEHSRPEHRILGLHFAERATDIDPEHEPTRTIIEDLGDTPSDSLPWSKAALIVLVLVLISGTMHVCNNHILAPEVTDEQTEEVREYLEEHGEPPR